MLSHIEKRDGAILTVSYGGTLTEAAPPPLPGCEKASDGLCTAVIIDMSGVEYINSLGVSAFHETAKYLKNRNIDIVLCCVTPQVLKVLKLARTDLLMPIVPSRATAKEYLFNMFQNKPLIQREFILIIQGDLDINNNLKDILKMTKQEANYAVVTALNPNRAWKILTGGKIQLILFDVTTTMNEGQTFLKRLRTNRELCGTPFLVVANEKGLPDAAYYTKNGADDIIRFPFNPYETPARIRTALSLYYSWKSAQASGKAPGQDSDSHPFIRG